MLPVPELEKLSRAEIEAEITGLFTREFLEETLELIPGYEIIETSEDRTEAVDHEAKLPAQVGRRDPV